MCLNRRSHSHGVFNSRRYVHDGTVSFNNRKFSRLFQFKVYSPQNLLCYIQAFLSWRFLETGEQLAVGVTILLSLVVFFLMVETRVPNTSDHLPLIAKYYCCTVIEISAVLAFTCVIHKFEHHGAGPCPKWVQVRACIDWESELPPCWFDRTQSAI